MKKKKVLCRICVVVAIMLVLTGSLFIRIGNHESLIGRITCKIIDVYMDGFDREQYYIVDEKEWKVPGGYRNTAYKLSNSTIELLENAKDGRHDHVIYQLHGGSYIRPVANEYRNQAVKYSKLTKGADVATLDYRTAPENVYPAALEDAVDGYEFLLKEGYDAAHIIVAGDSAGGNLALALTEYLRDYDYELPKAVIVMSPWADLSESGDSYEYNLHRDIMFGVDEGCKLEGYAIDNQYAGNTDLKDKYLSPVYADYENFPNMLIQAGTHEMLESDSITIYNKADKAGVDVTLTRYEGMFHQFEMYGFLPESRDAWMEVRSFIEDNWE